MKYTFISFFVLIIIEGCKKEEYCNSLPCNNKKFQVDNFYNIEFRRGIWVDVTNINDRSSTQDTIIFHSDSIWSYYNQYGGIFHKKYFVERLSVGPINKNFIKHNSRFFGPDTLNPNNSYIRYEVKIDTNNQFIYIDFNRDSRSISEPIVYSRFIKIE